MDVRTLAWYLLLAQVGTVFFLFLVLIRQLSLFRLRVQRELMWVRRTLFALALVIFIGNVYPMVISAATVLGLVTRSTHRVNALGVSYSSDNTLTLFFSALLIWITYKMAERVLIISERAKNNSLKEVQ